MEPQIYDEMVYNSNPLNTRVNRHGHFWVEKQFSANEHHNRILEVGGGTGEHIGYVKHNYDEYILSDLNEHLLAKAKERARDNKKVKFQEINALEIPFEDNSFDRLISMANLEHLPDPHIALREWKRVVKDGGTISIMIPTEGGIAWNLGRYLTTRRYFQKKGLDLDYIISREHINACYRLVAFIRHYYKHRKDHWWPLGIPTSHINLIYCTHIINR